MICSFIARPAVRHPEYVCAPSSVRRRRIRLLACLTLIVAGGCADSDPAAPEPTVSSVSVTPAEVALVSIGATAQLQAAARDQDGRAMSGQSVTWTSDDPGVATVGPAGLVEAVATGTARISASVAGHLGSVTVTVTQAVASVAVTPGTVEMVSLGEVVRLAADVRDAHGVAIPGVDVTWSSIDPGVAAIDGAGEATAIAEGTTRITASADGVAGDAEVRVDPVPALLAFIQSPVGSKAGDPFRAPVTVGVYDALGSIVADADLPVTVLLGENPVLGTLRGSSQVHAERGIATYPGLSLDRAAAGYTLLATSPGLEATESDAFTIDPCALGTDAFPHVLCVIDPLGDGPIDLVRLLMFFDDQGRYEIYLTAHPDRPFEGSFRVNLNVYHPAAFAFFQDTMNDFDLATPDTQRVLRGRSAALTLWSAGDEVYLHSLDGAPNPPGTSLFRSAIARLVNGELVGEDLIAFARRRLPAVVH